jgi:predicted phage terminase large subunit-like protein
MRTESRNVKRLADNMIRKDFASFARKAFPYEHNGNVLGQDRYIDLLCYELNRVALGEERRLLINLPPRHLKTFLCSICLPAWVLAHNPSTKTLIITNNDKLTEEITYKIRRILRAPWFQDIFSTRLAPDRSSVGDFATTKGGAVFGTSVAGSLAGRGSDLTIADDLVDFRDAPDVDHHKMVNERFDGPIMSRLNNPQEGRVVIVAHRLNANDLSAHVKRQAGWRRVVLPMQAVRKKTYDLGHGTWVRKPGDLLRRGFMSQRKIADLHDSMINPDFETLYQQCCGRGQRMTIKPTHFREFDPASVRLPVVLSVDPGQRGGEKNSYSVIQAWSSRGRDHFLLDQWREQCGFEALRQAYWRFVRQFDPSVALIEATAVGPALIEDALRRRRVCVVPIQPDNRSKSERLIEHIRVIRCKHIFVPEWAAWAEDFIDELVRFPGRFDDQVDALTQYLDWVVKNPTIDMPPQRQLGVAISTSGEPLLSPNVSTMVSGRAVLVRRSF